VGVFIERPSRRRSMKSLVSTIVALGLAVAFTGTAFASGPQRSSPPDNKADCEKAHMKWDDTSKKCSCPEGGTGCVGEPTPKA
jgi:hypothetical protein